HLSGNRVYRALRSMCRCRFPRTEVGARNCIRGLATIDTISTYIAKRDEEEGMTGHPVCVRRRSRQEKTMRRKILGTIAVGCLALVVGVVRQAQAQDAKTAYPSMAPLEQYLIADRNAEITLARSAAP